MVAPPFKATALFLGVFATQFMLVPQMLLDMNFEPAPTADEWHLFVMRPFGLLGLFLCYALWHFDNSWTGFLAAFNVPFSASLPWYAHATKPIKLPEHYVPTVGTAVLALWSVVAYLTAAPATTKKTN